MMKGAHMVYAKYFARKHEATGHVFEDRFKTWHINNDAYLLECGRYIERNPVRAKMVKDPAHYPWSSYGHYAYGKSRLRINANPLFDGLGASEAARQVAYRKYVETPRAYEAILDSYFFEKVTV